MEAASPPPLRSHRTVVAAVVVAALAVTAFSALGIASLLGWLPERQKAAFIPPEERKGANEPAPRAPRETLAPIDGTRAEPLMPRYSQPDPPPPAPASEPPASRAPTRVAVEPAPPVAGATPPAPPAREAPPREALPREAAGPRPPAYVTTGRPGRCDECGRVTGVSNRGDLWEIRVRFEDGDSRTFRYRNRPPFEAGDRVRLDGAFLDHD